jgi:hypothetical protein
VTIDWNDSKKRKDFREALQQAYPSAMGLQIFVDEALNENLAELAGGGNLREITFNLVDWAKAQGRLDELYQTFKRENPSYPVIKELEQQIFPTLESDQKVVHEGDQRAASSSLTASQRHRYQKRYDTLQSEVTLRFEKLSYLRNGLAIEVNPAIKFQLQKQVEEEEKQLERLETELVEVEKLLQSG